MARATLSAGSLRSNNRAIVVTGDVMKGLIAIASLWGLAGVAAAQPQEPTLRDLESKSPRKLSKDEVTQVMTGAKLSRLSGRGNQHHWSNDSGGNFVISSDNRGPGSPGSAQGRSSTALGKWHISDDGRYCVLIEWKGVPTEEWCRFVFETSDGYYTARSDSVGTERVYKIEIKK
jgi:Protein of unknown function (DUF995)